MNWFLSLFRPRTPLAPLGMAQEERYAAIERASTAVELEWLWTAWASRGQSREGLLYARLLERMQELGEPLSREEREKITLAAARRAHGKTLPPITGIVKGA